MVDSAPALAEKDECLVHALIANRDQCYSGRNKCELVQTEKWKNRCEMKKSSSVEVCDRVPFTGFEKALCELHSDNEARALKALESLLSTAKGTKELTKYPYSDIKLKPSESGWNKIVEICSAGKFIENNGEVDGFISTGIYFCQRLIKNTADTSFVNVSNCLEKFSENACLWLIAERNMAPEYMSSVCSKGNLLACKLWYSKNSYERNGEEIKKDCLTHGFFQACNRSGGFSDPPFIQKNLHLKMLESSLSENFEAIKWVAREYQSGNYWVDAFVEENIKRYLEFCEIEIGACEIVAKYQNRFPQKGAFEAYRKFVESHVNECLESSRCFTINELKKHDKILASVLDQACQDGKKYACKTTKEKEISKISCNFQELGDWRQFLNFDLQQNLYLSFEQKKKSRDPPYLAKLEMFKIGEITKGNCQGSEIYLVHRIREDENCDYDGKYGGETYRMFGVNFDSQDFIKKKPVTEPKYDGPTIGGECNATFRVIKIGKTFYSSSELIAEIEPELKKKDQEFQTVVDPAATYGKFGFYEKFDVKTNSGISIPAMKDRTENYYLRLKKKVDLNQYQELGSDSKFGTVYVRNLDSIVLRPDQTIEPVDLGLNETRTRYWYVDFLSNLKQEIGMSESDLIALPDQKSWFELKNPNIPFLKRKYANYLKRIASANKHLKRNSTFYERGKLGKTLSYDEYLLEKPLLFFKDPANRLQVHKKAIEEIPSLAEPLMYFYSKRPTDLTIQLCGNLKITKTIPEYNNLWRINATPNKKLLDLDTGKSYKQLFWEGFVGMIPQYRFGWVVTPNEVESLFDKILPKYGLSDVEIRDFKSYWVPRLNKAPFYRIEILPQEWIDRLCPIRILPKPDSFLRVHMRAYELAEYQTVEEPKLPDSLPARSGLTVIEWSGILN